ncbi:hypothetical protein A9Q83_09135 [Alphaproteobacteria bacterium 46_93_T64]|nr:hypothetical protein A9Q83_09135 [Alphaproteobacteria bacterium 46_93_T64]
MTSSPNKSLYLGAVVALLVSSSFSVTVGAQEKPRSLVPTFVEEQTGPTPKLVPNPLQAEKPLSVLVPESPTVKNKAEPVKSGDFVVQQLDAIHPATIGLINSDNGSLGQNMWQGTSTQLAAVLVDKIKRPDHSPQMLDLYRRLLLTGAVLPDTGADAEKLLDLRISSLIGAGWFDEARSLLKRLPQNAETTERQKFSANLDLLQGKEKEACRVAYSQKNEANEDSFWKKLDIFCRVLADDFDKAELGAALLEEDGESDSLFFTIFAALVGDKVDYSTIEGSVSALHFAMLRHSKGQFERSLVENSGLDVQKSMLALKERAGASALPIALNLVRADGVDTTAFIAEYTPSPVDDQNPQAADADTYTVMLDLLKSAETDSDRAIYIQALWQKAADAGDLFAVSALTLPVLETLPVGNYGADFNHKAVQLFLVHGKQSKAQEWERASRRAAFQGTPDERLAARKGIAILDNFILLSGAKGIARWNAASFPNWRKITSEDEGQAEKAAFLLSMMEVFGYSVTEENWDNLLLMDQKLTASNSNHALENNLVMAAVQGFVGKTVALSLLALGDEGPDKVSLTTLRAVTSALKNVGLVQEARQLALEVAVLRGL